MNWVRVVSLRSQRLYFPSFVPKLCQWPWKVLGIWSFFLRRGLRSQSFIVNVQLVAEKGRLTTPGLR